MCCGSNRTMDSTSAWKAILVWGAHSNRYSYKLSRIDQNKWKMFRNRVARAYAQVIDTVTVARAYAQCWLSGYSWPQ